MKRYDLERFWSRVEVPPGCWLWSGTVTKAGYGQISIDDRLVYAHRLMWELTHGPIPDGAEIDHRPECPKHCVNPAHLRITTHKQNLENRAGANRNSRSGVRGVYPQDDKWVAEVRHNDVKYYLGRYPTVEEAKAVVVAKRLELFTHNDRDR